MSCCADIYLNIIGTRLTLEVLNAPGAMTRIWCGADFSGLAEAGRAAGRAS